VPHEAPSRIPFIDLSRLTAAVRAPVLAEFAAVLDEQAFVLGPRVRAFEAALCGALGAEHAVACANGTDALVVGLMALGVRPGMRVALPDLTFWASYEAILHVGAVPVLLDVDPDDLQLDVQALMDAHAAQPLDACLYVHLFGWTSPRLEALRDFCKARGIRLLEDGAQAFGVEHAGTSVLASAHIATLSFYPAKVLGGCLDGGAVLTRDAALASDLRALCNHGRTAHYAHDRVGVNSRMGGLAAAYLQEMLKLREALLGARRSLLARYIQVLAEVKGVRLYAPPEGQRGNGYLCVLGLHDAASVAHCAQALSEAGIATARTYPIPVHAQPGARAAQRFGSLLHSTAFCEPVLNLPLFYGMTNEEQTRCIEGLISALHDGSRNLP
jgi:dTDP-4-amino-4,6-dideoxygalactose transaminase